MIAENKAIKTETAATVWILKRKPVTKPSNALSVNKIITIRIIQSQDAVSLEATMDQTNYADTD